MLITLNVFTLSKSNSCHNLKLLVPRSCLVLMRGEFFSNPLDRLGRKGMTYNFKGGVTDLYSNVPRISQAQTIFLRILFFGYMFPARQRNLKQQN